MQRKPFVAFILLACLTGLIAGCQGSGNTTAAAPEGTTPQNTTQQRIGVYDSRAVAVAFAGSAKHEARTANELAALKSARADGDPELIATADQRVWDARKRLHRQGFSTAPVDDILALYPDQIEALKTEHNLAALVSKWDKQTLASFPNAQQVDITEDLIEVPNPNDRQRHSALEVQNHKPLTPAQVEKVIKHEMQ